MASHLGAWLPAQAIAVAGFPLRPGRGTKYESMQKTLRTAARGEHAVAPKSRRSFTEMGRVGTQILAALDGQSSAFDSPSSWSALAFGLDFESLEPYFRAPLKYLSDLQETVAQADALAQNGQQEKTQRLLHAAYGGNPLLAWREFLAPDVQAASFVLTSTLDALAILDAEQQRCNQGGSLVLELLTPGHTPMAHWCVWARDAFGANTFDMLSGRAAALRTNNPGDDSGVSLSHELFRKWSAGTQLPQWTSVDTLSSGLTDPEKGRVRAGYALARVATFLVSALASLSEPELAWDEARNVLRTRYVYQNRAPVLLPSGAEGDVWWEVKGREG